MRKQVKIQQKRDEQITARCLKKDKEIIIQKAKKQNKSVSEYMIDSALAGTERHRTKERKRTVILIKEQEQLNRLQECLDNDAPKQVLQEEIKKLIEGSLKEWEF